MPNVSVSDFGAKGDGRSDDSAAIQKAVDACAASGGGRVVLPSGRVFVCGPVQLRSNIELHLEHASRLKAIPGRSLYTQETMAILGGDGRKWLHADRADNIAITGGGTIDGSGVAFMKEELPAIFRTDADRPFMLHLEACRRISLRDVTFEDAPFWTVHLAGCEDVAIDGIRILDNVKIANSDGIDIHRCRNVRVSGCTIIAGDDGICLKSERGYEALGDCEDIVVTGCTIRSTSCAIKIGSGTAGAIRRVVVSGCSVFASHRGLGIQARDQGLVEDVLFSDITVQTRYEAACWWGDATPIYVTAMRREEGAALGCVRDVRFSNIRCRGENGVLIASEGPEHLHDVELEDVAVAIQPSAGRAAGRYDFRPCAARPAVIEGPTDGFHILRAAGVTLRKCSVAWPEPPQAYHRHAVYSHDAPKLCVEGLTGSSAFPDRLPPVMLA